MHSHQADSAGHAIGVLGQFRKGRIACGLDVSSNAVDQLVGIPRRDMVPRQRIRPGQGQRVVGPRMAGQRTPAPNLEHSQPIAVCLIHQVVADAAKGIERAHGPSLGWREQAGSQVKGLAVLLGQSHTVRIGSIQGLGIRLDRDGWIVVLQWLLGQGEQATFPGGR